MNRNAKRKNLIVRQLRDKRASECNPIRFRTRNRGRQMLMPAPAFRDDRIASSFFGVGASAFLFIPNHTAARMPAAQDPKIPLKPSLASSFMSQSKRCRKFRPTSVKKINSRGAHSGNCGSRSVAIHGRVHLGEHPRAGCQLTAFRRFFRRNTICK